MNAPAIEAALADISQRLHGMGRPFALVGGLAVSFRAEVRFTRDVDLAVVVKDDADFESLVFDLRSADYFPVAIVEHTQKKKLATARLQSPMGFVIDLIAASCGIEREVVERASLLHLPGVGQIPVARAEELLAMKILSMTDRRLQDRVDARNLVVFSDDLDLSSVKDNLDRITERGFHRDQDLHAKLSSILADVRRDD